MALQAAAMAWHRTLNAYNGQACAEALAAAAYRATLAATLAKLARTCIAGTGGVCGTECGGC